MSDRLERIWAWLSPVYAPSNVWSRDRPEQDLHGDATEYVRLDLYEALRAERDEARRRRDEWRKKAEDYDTIRHALREKVGAPWPPNMSRALWAGIAADEKKRADDAEAEIATLRARVSELEAELAKANNEFGSETPDWPDLWRRIAALKELSNDRWRLEKTAYRRGLEDAAKVADEWQNETGTDIAAAARICPEIAAAIRALAEKEK